MSGERYPTAKVLVLGDSGVGKSSFIHLICHSSVLTTTQWTIGCAIDIKLHNNHFLEFWDVGGSRGHKLARAFLYKEYRGIILVYDASNNKSRNNLHEWLDEINNLKPYVPILTIATKKDQMPEGTFDNDHPDLDQQHDINNKLSKHCKVNLLTPTPESQQTTFQQKFHSQNDQNNFKNRVRGSWNGDNTSKTIYVDTQDSLSFDQTVNPKNYSALSTFFKQVIDNKFVI